MKKYEKVASMGEQRLSAKVTEDGLEWIVEVNSKAGWVRVKAGFISSRCLGNPDLWTVEESLVFFIVDSAKKALADAFRALKKS